MGWGSEQSALHRTADAGLALLAGLFKAILLAAAVAALVYLLPGKFSVLVLTLYGFIAIGLLQAAAALVLAILLMRALVRGWAADDWRAILLCGGFLIVIALCNSYILALGRMWDKDFGFSVDDIVLARFFSLDQHVLAIGATALTLVGDFFDHLALSVLHVSQAPLAHAFGAIAAAMDHAMPADAATRTGTLGLVAGAAFAGWLWVAKGSTG